MSIPSGSKILICGRTGSGKSSLLSAIARGLEISAGSLLIDGLDLSELQREAVRSAIGFIPQELLRLPGTVLYNIDPTNDGNESDAEYSLAKVGLLDKVKAYGGLKAPMNNLPLSVGENQLFSIARIMMKKSKVLLLDEVASATNEETAQNLERIIFEQFANSTV